MSERKSRLAVIVCSVGRPECLAELADELRRQSRPADHMVFAVTNPADITKETPQGFPDATQVDVIHAAKGLPKQRNAGLDLVQGQSDFILFLDDDFVPSRHCFADIITAFDQLEDVNGMTGYVIADGISNAGFDHAQAQEMVGQWDESHPPLGTERRLNVLRRGLEGLYGCNMAYRCTAIGTTRFDEALPLYAWQEDVDFAARITGERIKTDAFAGVHRGIKSGRETSGRLLGYSQLANPWYLWRKGSMTARFAGRLAMRNIAANHLKTFRPEPWIDRRGRAAGNRRAMLDILLGRARPDRILDL